MLEQERVSESSEASVLGVPHGKKTTQREEKIMLARGIKMF